MDDNRLPRFRDWGSSAEHPQTRSDRRLMSGFVWQPDRLGVRQFKRTACSLRIRLVASADGLTHSSSVLLAKHLRISARTVHNYFPVKEAMFAFPPPEMAVAIVEATEGVAKLADVPACIAPLLEALQGNDEGRMLIHNLVRAHETHPELRAADSYFSTEMRLRLEARPELPQPVQVPLVGFFTEALRLGLEEWASQNCPSASVIEQHLRKLLESNPTDHSQAADAPKQTADPDDV